MDPRNPKAILDLASIVDVPGDSVDLEVLRELSRNKRPRSGRSLGQRDLTAEMLDSFLAIVRGITSAEWYVECEEDLVCLVKRVSPLMWGGESCAIRNHTCVPEMVGGAETNK